MHTNVKIIIAVFFITLLAEHVSAQDFKKDYDKVKESYSKLDVFSCELTVNVFDDYKSVNASQTMTSVLKKQKNDFWYSMGKIKMVMNDQSILYINEDTKEMVYTIRDLKSEPVIPNQNASEVIDTILRKYDSVVYIGVVENCKKYIIYSSKALISKTELLIGQDNHLIKKMTYYYLQNGKPSTKVIINYSKMDLVPQFSKDEFSDKKYAVYSKGSLKPIGRYAGYQTSVINQKDFK